MLRAAVNRLLLRAVKSNKNECLTQECLSIIFKERKLMTIESDTGRKIKVSNPITGLDRPCG